MFCLFAFQSLSQEEPDGISGPNGWHVVQHGTLTSTWLGVPGFQPSELSTNTARLWGAGYALGHTRGSRTPSSPAPQEGGDTGHQRHSPARLHGGKPKEPVTVTRGNMQNAECVRPGLRDLTGISTTNPLTSLGRKASPKRKPGAGIMEEFRDCAKHPRCKCKLSFYSIVLWKIPRETRASFPSMTFPWIPAPTPFFLISDF